MKASHKTDRASVTFDDPNLVANAGLMLTGTLMRRLGLIDVIDQRVKLRGRVGGANPGIKAATVISGLLAGADCIDDTDILRAGASGDICGHELRAPPPSAPGYERSPGAMSANSTPQQDRCDTARSGHRRI